jgi:hypothetical protein
MTILIAFHQSNNRNFKHYYIDYDIEKLDWAFPKWGSYNRFVELVGEFLVPF